MTTPERHIPMSDEEVEALRRGLEGVTPTGWNIATVALGTRKVDIEHFNRCSPDAISRLLARLDAAEARLSAVAASGAVEVKALEWREPSRRHNGCWTAESILGTFSVGFDDGWRAYVSDGMRWEWEPENAPRSYDGPFAGQAACQAYLDSRILSALTAAPPSPESDRLRDRVREAVEAEREACALIAEDQMPATQDMTSTFICEALERAAAAIRARTGGSSNE